MSDQTDPMAGEAAPAERGEPRHLAEPRELVERESVADPIEDDALLSRLRLIESQPLEERAAAFGQLHDELSTVLEGADTSGDRD